MRELTTLSDPPLGWKGWHTLQIPYHIDIFGVSALAISIPSNFGTTLRPCRRCGRRAWQLPPCRGPFQTKCYVNKCPLVQSRSLPLQLKMNENIWDRTYDFCMKTPFFCCSSLSNECSTLMSRPYTLADATVVHNVMLAYATAGTNLLTLHTIASVPCSCPFRIPLCESSSTTHARSYA